MNIGTNKKSIPVELEQNSSPNSKISDYFKMLRTNISFKIKNEDLSTLLITSPKNDDGAANTVLNLALTMSQIELKVLIVDANYYSASFVSPSIKSVLNLPEKGLSDFYVDGGGVSNYIVGTPYDNVSVLPSGKIFKSASEFFASDMTDSVMKELKAEYDLILFACAPILVNADAQVLSEKVDGTILVVRRDYTKKQDISSSIERLHLVKANVLGTVMYEI